MDKYEALMVCFRSGQMDEAQFQEHMRSDKLFADWVGKLFQAATKSR